MKLQIHSSYQRCNVSQHMHYSEYRLTFVKDKQHKNDKIKIKRMQAWT